MIDNLPVICLGNTVDLHRSGFIDQIEQSRKRIAQADATATAVANIVDPLEFREKGGFIVKLGLILSERVPCGRVETAFPG